MSRARNSRVFTAGTLISSAADVSAMLSSSMSLDSTHNVLVMLADEQRFELPARFSVRVRQMLAEEFEKNAE
jgi:hypothetical protein